MELKSNPNELLNRPHPKRAIARSFSGTQKEKDF